MDISTNMQSLTQSQNTVKTNFTEKITKDEVKEIKEQISQNANAMMFNSTSIQSSLTETGGSSGISSQGFQSFLKDIGYEGKPLAQLSQSEAAELISDDGIFGIKQTSERIANFVIQGADGNEDRLRAGREGMMKGFAEATKMLGDSMPDISQKTMQAAIEMVDKEMHDLGFSILNAEA